MKLHPTLVLELVRIFETHGGHREEWRLKNELSKLDVAMYTRQSGEQIIVSSKKLKEQSIQK